MALRVVLRIRIARVIDAAAFVDAAVEIDDVVIRNVDPVSGIARPGLQVAQVSDRVFPLREGLALVRERLGPVAAFKLAITVARLPKTRSGKILRGTMKKIADGEAWTMPATIEDPKVLDEIGDALRGRV